MSDKIYSIYKAENIINGKVYIGFTSKELHIRKKGHLTDIKKRSRYFQNAIVKYGEENFTWEIIYQSKDKQHCLSEMENYFITEYRSYNGFDDCNGYNLTLGGEGGLGRICTDEERLAKSLRLKGIKFSEEHINKINKNPEKIKKTADKHRGMKRSEQAKQTMSDSRKGCKANNKGQKCYYNIELNKRIYLNADDPIPEGYVDKVPNLNKNKIWIHNPTTNERTFHQKDQTLPEGYILGRGKRN